MNPHHRISEFRESRLLNFAGAGDGQGAGGQQDGADEPAPDTPAGKKWKALRDEKKAAEDAAKAEREKRIAAEAKAQAFEELKASFGPKEKPQAGGGTADDTEDVKINPEDEKLMNAFFSRQIKKMGLDQIPEVVKALQQNTHDIQASTSLSDAKAALESEFAGSVPFNYEETLKYAKEKGFGMTFSNVKDALRMAHKEMNEASFIEFYKGGAKPKKVVPKMAASGREADDVIEIPDEKVIDPEKLNSFDDARRAAKQLFPEDGE